MTINNKILFVEDDKGVINVIEPFLVDHGYVVNVVNRADDVMPALLKHKPALLLLDRRLPDGDGLDVIRTLNNTDKPKIILLTGINDPIEKVVGLELGADDYITKPFHMREFLARIRAVLRRESMSNEINYVPPNISTPDFALFNNWTYDMTKGFLSSPKHKDIYLTGAEQRLLSCLLNKIGKIVNKDELYEIVSNRSNLPDSRSIEVLISSLRKKLKDNTRSPAFIKTVRGMGYVFIATTEFK